MWTLVVCFSLAQVDWQYQVWKWGIIFTDSVSTSITISSVRLCEDPQTEYNLSLHCGGGGGATGGVKPVDTPGPRGG